MGMFDSVLVDCASCNKKIEFQSKAWFCEMACYTLENAPAPIL